MALLTPPSVRNDSVNKPSCGDLRQANPDVIMKMAAVLCGGEFCTRQRLERGAPRPDTSPSTS